MPATLASGDQRYLERQFRLHEPALARFLVGMVRDRVLAEDLLQDTFVEACRNPHRMMDASSPAAWLFGVARHRALSAHRTQRRFTVAISRLRGHPAAIADDEQVSGALDLLETLDPTTRALVLLRYVHGFGAPELAEITGRSPTAIRKQLERARAHLSRQLSVEGSAAS